MSAPRTTCAECGYDLAGAGPAPAQARCPECGTEFDPRQPWTVRAWPAWRRTVWRMCRGTVWMGVSTWVLIIGASHLLEAAAALAVPLVIFCWLFAIIWPPTETARDLTNTCMPKRGRERRRLAMSLGGIGLNVFLFLAWLVITGVFAGL